MRLGCRVNCSAYIRPSGNCYEKMAGGCYYHEHGKNEEVDIEGFHNCERYKTIEKMFSGVFAGTTTLCTRLNAESFNEEYASGFRFYCDDPQKFAIVYYAENKKRLVPLEKCYKED